jgi:hypothetical protein
VNASQIIRDLRERGFAVRLKGDRVSVIPAPQLTATDRERIKSLLPHLKAELATPAVVHLDLSREDAAMVKRVLDTFNGSTLVSIGARPYPTKA